MCPIILIIFYGIAITVCYKGGILKDDVSIVRQLDLMISICRTDLQYFHPALFSTSSLILSVFPIILKNESKYIHYFTILNKYLLDVLLDSLEHMVKINFVNSGGESTFIYVPRSLFGEELPSALHIILNRKSQHV